MQLAAVESRAIRQVMANIDDAQIGKFTLEERPYEHS